MIWSNSIPLKQKYLLDCRKELPQHFYHMFSPNSTHHTFPIAITFLNPSFDLVYILQACRAWSIWLGYLPVRDFISLKKSA